MMTDSLQIAWNKLEAFLTKLLGGDLDNSSNDSVSSLESWYTPELYLTLYTLVFEYCIQYHEQSASSADRHGIQGGALYTQLVTFIDRRLSTITITNVDDYLKWWEKYERAAECIEAVFHYLDRFWAKRQMEESNGDKIFYIYPLLWDKWREHILDKYERSILFAMLGTQLGIERDNDANNNNYHNDQAMEILNDIEDATETIIKKVIRSYDVVSMVPVKSLLRSTAIGKVKTKHHPLKNQLLLGWYCTELGEYCNVLLKRSYDESKDAVEIIGRLNNFWNKEINRMDSYFGICQSMPLAEIGKMIKDTMKNHLLLCVMDDIKKCLTSTISETDDPIKTLKLIYEFTLQRKSLIPQLVESVEQGFTKRLALRVPKVNVADHMLMFISMLSAMFIEGRKIVGSSFSADPLMITAVDNALRMFLCSPDARKSFASMVPEFLCRWIDKSLFDKAQSSIKGDDILFVMTMLRFIDDKESFQLWYSKLLARRLLYSNRGVSGSGSSSSSRDLINRQLEEQVLNELATGYGQGFVSNYRRMLADTEASVQQTMTFLNTKTKRMKLPFEISFQVLGSAYWPFKEEPTIKWDERLAESLDSFSQFYLYENKRRVFSWSPSLTTVLIHMTIPKTSRNYTLILSAIQLSIVNALVSHQRTGEELCAMIGISNELVFGNALNKLLSSGLVSKIPDGTFVINENFSHTHSKLNLAIDTERVITQQRETVEDHSFAIQAHIVRLLKRVEKYERSKLMEEMATRFTNVHDVEKILKVLEEKEFISVQGDHIVYMP